MTHKQAFALRTILLVALAACGWFAIAARCAECDVQELRLPLADGTSIYARLYVPLTRGQQHPAVVICHGYLANSGFMETPWAADLAGLGLVALFLDRRGHGRSGGNLHPNAAPTPVPLSDEHPDIRAALAYLRTQSQLVDPDRLALLGHSDGATAALVVASADWHVAATIAISASLAPWEYVNHIVPRNLLLLYGSEDHFVLSDTDRSLIRHATRGYLQDAGTVGSMHDGSARALARIPGYGHVTLLHSTQARQTALRWLAETFEIAAVSSLSPQRTTLVVAGMVVLVLLLALWNGLPADRVARDGVLIGAGRAAAVTALWCVGLALGAWLTPRIVGVPAQEGRVVASVLGAEALLMGGAALAYRGLWARHAPAVAWGDIGRGIGAAVLVQVAIEILVTPVYAAAIDTPRLVLFMLCLALAAPAFAATCSAGGWLAGRVSRHVPIEAVLGLITVAAAPVLFVRMAAFPIVLLGVTLVLAGAYRAGGWSTASVAAFASVLYARAASVVCALY